MFFKAELHDWIRENKVYSEDDVEEFIRISGKKKKKELSLVFFNFFTY